VVGIPCAVRAKGAGRGFGETKKRANGRENLRWLQEFHLPRKKGSLGKTASSRGYNYE